MARVALPAVTLLCAALLAGCGKSGEQKGGKKGPPKVGYIVTEVSAVPLSATLGGRTVAFETSEVRPQVAGVIQKRLFTEGSIVRAGQPLFQIDPSLYRAAANQARANLQSARASADAAIARAQRYKPLAEMQAVAAQDYTDAASQARVARATIAQNAAALETAQVNLRFTTVPAPISGRIGRSLVTVGGLASNSQTTPLAIIQRTDPMFVDMQQSASDLVALRRKLRSGGVEAGSTQVTLKFEDGTNYPLPGIVQFSEVTVNQETGTVTLRARFPNPQGLILPGTFVNAVFDQAVENNAILVPQQAIQRDFDGSAYVMMVGRDNKAVRRKVATTRTYRNFWVVTGGLKRGEKVILQGLNGLKQGTAIVPVPANAPQDPTKAPSGSGAKGQAGEGGSAAGQSQGTAGTAKQGS